MERRHLHGCGDWAQDLQTRAGATAQEHAHGRGRPRAARRLRRRRGHADGPDAGGRRGGAHRPSTDGDKIARDLQARLQSLRTTLVKREAKGAGRCLTIPPSSGRRPRTSARRFRKPAATSATRSTSSTRSTTRRSSKSFNDNPRCSDLARSSRRVDEPPMNRPRPPPTAPSGPIAASLPSERPSTPATSQFRRNPLGREVRELRCLRGEIDLGRWAVAGWPVGLGQALLVGLLVVVLVADEEDESASCSIELWTMTSFATKLWRPSTVRSYVSSIPSGSSWTISSQQALPGWSRWCRCARSNCAIPPCTPLWPAGCSCRGELIPSGRAIRIPGAMSSSRRRPSSASRNL